MVSHKNGTKILLIGCFILLILGGCARQTGEKVVREAFAADIGEREEWGQYLWTQDAVIEWDGVEGHDAPGSMRIDAGADNDARLVWEVPVEPKTHYKITCWVRTEGVGTGELGVNLSILNMTCLFGDIRGTSGWQPITLYGVTGANQRTVNLTMGIGGYGRLNSGIAWFDDVAVERLEGVPAGAAVAALGPEEATEEAPGMPTVLGLGLTLAVVLFVGLILMMLRYHREGDSLGEQKSDRRVFWLMFAGALVLRLVLAASFRGQTNDTGCFQGWAWTAGQGLFHFYDNAAFIDYPPLYIYVLSALGALARVLGIALGTGVYTVLLKLPSIAADLIVAGVLYRYGTQKKDRRLGLLLMVVYALNPAIWVNSTLWGQVDSVLTLWIVLYLLAVEKRNLHHAAAWLAAAVLTKPQGLLVAPILLFAWIRERNIRLILRSALWGIAAFSVIIFPFAVQYGPLWIFKLLMGTASQYPYASLNGYNLFSLLGANLRVDSDILLFLPYKVWGVIGMAASVLYAGYIYLRRRETSQRVWLSALLLVAGVFTLGYRMHERYLYPAVALACFWAAGRRDHRGYILAAGFSVTVFANTFHVLVNDAVNAGYMHIPAENLLLRIGSLLNCLLLGYLVYLSLDKDREIKRDQPSEERTPPPSYTYDREAFTKKDTRLIALVTGIYLIVALLNLGSFRTPRSCWTARERGETVEITFAEQTTLTAFNWYGRLGEGSFSVSAEGDTGQYREIATFESKAYPDFGKWRHAELEAPVVTGRVRVTAASTGVEIAEMGWFDGSGRAVPVAFSSPGGGIGDMHPIADEQERVAYYHSYLTGTYFDEIYHVRTAYEQMEHFHAYEYTHPPLGKIIISSGIALFGMTTFGWRLPGTLFGAAMIPLMYAFGRALFGRRRWALAAALLMALDFMHFSQTRMATVDTYTAFFTILMFYFMYRYIRRYEEGRSFGYGLWMLCLCGISLGLGGSCKWSALYGATGLAFLFFWDLYRQAHSPAPPALGGSFGRQTAVTILASVGFFLLIPAVIYTLSYIPYFQEAGAHNTLKDMIQLQKSMYHYHSTLVATHDFASPWWSWPLIGRPLWLFIGEGQAEGMRSTIVSMGNPLIWWPILPAAVATGVIGWVHRDRRALFLLVAVVSQYLPWILVSRIAFIYHFFPILPFGMLCIVYVLQMLSGDHPWIRKAMWWYLGACLLLFVWFYPALSGLAVPEWWIHSLRWIGTWYF